MHMVRDDDGGGNPLDEPQEQREQCRCCGRWSSGALTVWRCECCGKPVCSLCLAERSAPGLYCRECVESGAAELGDLQAELDAATCPDCRALGSLDDDGAGGFRCRECGYELPLPAADSPMWDRLMADIVGATGGAV